DHERAERGVTVRNALAGVFAALSWPIRAAAAKRAAKMAALGEAASRTPAVEAVSDDVVAESKPARRRKTAEEKEAERAVEEETEAAAAAADDVAVIEPRKKLTAEELKAKIAKLPVRMGSATKKSARDE